MSSPSEPTGPYTPVTFVLTKYRQQSLLKRHASAQAFLSQTCTPGGLIRLLATPAGLSLIEASQSGPEGVMELWLDAEHMRLVREGLRTALTEGGLGQREAIDLEARAWGSRGRGVSVEASRLTISSEGEGKKVYKSQGGLDRALKGVKKQLDRIGSDKVREEVKSMQRVYEVCRQRLGKVVALDVETWELDHDLITEIGVTVVELADGRVDSRHYVVEENQRRRNGRYVKDRREFFTFGETVHLPSSQITTELRTLLTPTPPASYPILLVLHAPQSDLVALAQLSIDVPSFHPSNALTSLLAPSPPSHPGVFIVDTQILFRGWTTAIGLPKLTSLGKVCERMNMPTTDLHNAGNDARYTWMVFERMMNGVDDGPTEEVGGQGKSKGQQQGVSKEGVAGQKSVGPALNKDKGADRKGEEPAPPLKPKGVKVFRSGWDVGDGRVGSGW